MTSFLVMLALNSAYAGERLNEKPWLLGSYLGSADTVTLDKEIQVKGYYDNYLGIYVEATAGDEDKKWLFKISTRQSVISVNDEFVKKNKLKVYTQLK